VRGKVLAYSDYDGSGVISGDDGVRYAFVRGGLQGAARAVPAGADVDFEVGDGKAINIYVLATGMALNSKSRIAAALLAWFLGAIGIHKFYLGKTNAGVIMLICGTVGWFLIFPGLGVCLIAFIEFIIYLTKSDEQFYQDYVVGDRQWF
jgi:TM2 domain-containing membrane protein YozV